MYDSVPCSNCPFQQSMLRTYKNGRGLVVFNELANGDLKSWLFNSKYNYTQFASMWCQIILAGFGIEEQKIVHHDLHWGNLLYHNVPSSISKYTHYQIKSDDIYVLNTGQHWVLWDFGEIQTQMSYSKSVNVDMFRISHVSRWSSDEGHYMGKNEEIICQAVRRFSSVAKDYYDLLKHIFLILNIIDKNQNILLINPKIKPMSSEIINKNPYILQ